MVDCVLLIVIGLLMFSTPWSLEKYVIVLFKVRVAMNVMMTDFIMSKEVDKLKLLKVFKLIFVYVMG